MLGFRIPDPKVTNCEGINASIEQFNVTEVTGQILIGGGHLGRCTKVFIKVKMLL